MAGGHIGDLTIRVRPDSAGFRRDLGRQLNKAIREATGILKELKVAPRMDTTAFKKDMKDLKDIVKDEKVSVSVEADYEDAIRGVHDFKRELANERVEIKVDADTSTAEGQLSRLKKLIRDVRSDKVPVQFSSDGGAKYLAATAAEMEKFHALVAETQKDVRALGEERLTRLTKAIDTGKLGIVEWQSEMNGLQDSLGSVGKNFGFDSDEFDDMYDTLQRIQSLEADMANDRKKANASNLHELALLRKEFDEQKKYLDQIAAANRASAQAQAGYDQAIRNARRQVEQFNRVLGDDAVAEYGRRLQEVARIQRDLSTGQLESNRENLALLNRAVAAREDELEALREQVKQSGELFRMQEQSWADREQQFRRELRWITTNEDRQKDALENIERERKRIVDQVRREQRAYSESEMSQIGGLDRQREVIVRAMTDKASMAAVAAQLTALTRDRVVNINAKVNAGNLGRLAEFITGAGFLKQLWNDLHSFLFTVDRAIPKIAGLSLVFGNLASAIGSAAASLITVAADLGRIWPLMLTIPGLFTGLALSVGAVVMAMYDLKTELGELGPAFSEIREVTSAAFWKRARRPILDLAYSVLPALKNGFVDLADGMGTQFALAADQMRKSFAGGVLERIFANTRKGIDEVNKGVGAWTDALVQLIDVGASYLPRMGKWIADIGQQFNSWLTGVRASGELAEMIEVAITNVKALGKFLYQTTKLIGGLADAAEAAGFKGLVGWADAMEAMNTAVRGPAFQRTLTTILKGMRDGMIGLGQGVMDASTGFQQLAGPIGEVLGILGRAGGELFADLVNAMGGSSAFKKGMLDFAEGLSNAVTILGPAWPWLADFFGKVMTLLGTMMESFAEIAAKAKEVLAPLGDAILDSLSDLIPGLTDIVTGALDAIQPVIEWLTEAFEENGPEIILAIAAIGLAIAFLSNAFTAILPVIGFVVANFGTIVGAAQKVSGAVSGGMGFGRLIGVFSRVLGWVGLIITALVAMWTNSEKFRDGFVGLFEGIWEGIQNFLEPILEQITAAEDDFQAFSDTLGIIFGALGDVIGPGLQHAGELIAGLGSVLGGVVALWQWAFNQITVFVELVVALLRGDWDEAIRLSNDSLQDLMNALGPIGEGIVAIFQSIVDFLSETWGPVFEEIGAFVEEWFNSILMGVTAFGGAFAMNIKSFTDGVAQAWNNFWNEFGAAVDRFLAPITEAWNNFWNDFSAAITGFLTPIAEAWQTFWSGFSNTVTEFVGGITASWNEFWQGLQQTFNEAWQPIQTLITEGWTVIQNAFTMAFSAIQMVIDTAWSTIQTTFTTAWTVIQNILAAALLVIVAIVTGDFESIKSVISAAWENIKSVVTNAVNTVKSTVTSGFNAASSTTTQIWNGIKSFMSGAWENIKSIVTNAVNNVKSTITNTFNSIRDTVSNVISNVRNTITSTFNSIVSSVSGSMQSMSSTVSSGVNNVVSWFRGLPGQIMGAVSGLASMLVSVGSQMMSGLINGITGAAGGVVGAIVSAVTSAINAAKSTLGIASPSKVFRFEIGEMVGKGFALGILDQVGAAQKAMHDLVEAPTPDELTMRVGVRAVDAIGHYSNVPGVDSLSEGGEESFGSSDYYDFRGGKFGYDPQEIIDAVDRKKREKAARVPGGKS